MTHEELVSVPFNEGRNRFCLDRVTDPSGSAEQYAFVWRGNARGPNAFVPKPAYFSWEVLGQTIREAMVAGDIPYDDVMAFLAALVIPPRTQASAAVEG